MLRKLAKWFYDSRIQPSSAKRMALASSVGIFIGMLPLFGVRIPILLVISLLLPLNFPALMFGAFVPFILPFLHELSFFLGQKIAGFEIPYSNLRYLSFSHLLQWSPGTQYHLIGSLVVGLFLSFFFHPFFRWIYRFSIFNTMKEYKPFIFLDPDRKRWTLVKKILVVTLGVGLIVGSVFGVSISINPYLPSLGLHKIRQFPGISPIAQQLGEKTLTKELRKEYKKRNLSFTGVKTTGTPQNIMAFYVSWDENSFISLQQNINSIQTLIPDWYHLNKDSTLGSQVNEQVDLLAQSRQVKETPLINNYVNDKWDGEIVHQLLSNQKAQNQFIQDLANQMKGHHYSGINIDFEGLNPQDQTLYTQFIGEISREFHKQGLTVTLDLPPKDGTTDSPFDYKTLAVAADQIVLMAYDEHYEGGDPGPIASGKFIQDSIASLDIPRNKLIVSLGNYGYDWIDNSNQAASEVTYSDILSMAADSKLKIYWNNESGNPYMRYKDGNENHTVWFLDGSTFYNQLKISLNDGVNGIAVWRLGSEDPSIWKALKNDHSLTASSNMLTTLESPDPVKYIGKGEVLRIVSIARQGKREITLDANGFVNGENYVSFPTPFEVERFGKPKVKEVALTFDDGPDPNYTPRILDTLAQYHVPATFFVVGQNASVNPDLIERMYREGHEIGNHTFTHPNVADISPLQTKVELNATERLIQELTGHSSVLFRPPYVADAEPSSPAELLPILRAQETGYTMVGEMIDPLDWTRPAPDEIVNRVNSQLKYGNVILLHDAGGDRSNTVAALPKIIESLKSQGYSFVTVGQLIGKNRDAVMPPVNQGDNPYMLYDTMVFSFVSFLWNFIAYLFYAAIILGVFRLIFLGYYALKQKRKRVEATPGETNFSPPVSVVIAAYNEEKVIIKTLESILQSDYPDFEIIVVDDGSTDNTSAVIQQHFSSHSKVRLITKANGGKSSAVNRGIREARGDIIVALDADTVIRKDTISLLLPHFSDPKVAAVSGNIKVGNVSNLLTNWQHVEYVTAFNLERRAFSMLNCITVVPGAIGAWRKEAVIQCGLFQEDTLAEDTDLTLQLLKAGYKVEFEEFAFAYTEAPSDVKSLFKQRFRWTYGTLQCLWKYRKELFNPRRKTLGFIALPNMWLFQFIFQALSPIADVYFILGLFGAHPVKVAVFYLLFFLLDLIASLFAFKLEGERFKPLMWVFLQRVLYRQIMALVVLKSIITAVKGIAVGWNKLQRQGDVEVPTTFEDG